MSFFVVAFVLIVPLTMGGICLDAAKKFCLPRSICFPPRAVDHILTDYHIQGACSEGNDTRKVGK